MSMADSAEESAETRHITSAREWRRDGNGVTHNRRRRHAVFVVQSQPHGVRYGARLDA